MFRGYINLPPPPIPPTRPATHLENLRAHSPINLRLLILVANEYKDWKARFRAHVRAPPGVTGKLPGKAPEMPKSVPGKAPRGVTRKAPQNVTGNVPLNF